MKFKEKDINLDIDGMGIVFFSQKKNKNIQIGKKFLKRGEEGV